MAESEASELLNQEIAKLNARDAMLQAPGRPPTPPKQAFKTPERPQQQQPMRTVIGALQEMQARDAKEYGDLIQYLRDFAGQKRADLEYFERLIGVK